ncbi:MAG: carboxypeptidase regulatory-like domain-containing protein [Acinetobacter sp.]|jgi:hypothetical protein|nr:MAG: carboxypeptidase regulatory-like domain-containing protein [Acinetobacter sp.]
MIFKKSLLAMLCSTVLVACGGGSDGSDNNPSEQQPVEKPGDKPPIQEEPVTKISEIQLLDANNQPIVNATVKILSSKEWGEEYKGQGSIFLESVKLPVAADFGTASFGTDGNGVLKVDSLMPDQYYVWVKKQNVDTITAFLVQKTNTAQATVVISPMSCNDETCEVVKAVVGSLAGQVMTNGKPLANAQVSLSAGAETNGAFTTAMTDHQGHFKLTFNVSDKLVDALKKANLMVNAEGYNALVQSVAVTNMSSSGNVFQLSQKNGNQQVIWKETFEADSATRSLWQIDQTVDTVKWNLLQSNQNITNALVDKYVKLAPNDTTKGVVPKPLQGNFAYWYGNTSHGNFLGEQSEYDKTGLDGGTSIIDNQGMLTSPSIDLSKVAKPISLTFKTWWEIESVNPNEDGFDLMNIQVSIDNGKTFKTIARLNPLSDPDSNLDREPLPFSNFGFNTAPAMSQQEMISLDEYAGQSNVKLRFEFKTEDELYNGFRGWMIDDIVIQPTQGTFPLYKGYDSY